MKVTTAISFGDIAIRKGVLSKEGLQEALLLHAVAQRRRQDVSLQDVMIQAGLLTREQAGDIEREQEQILQAQAESDVPAEVQDAMQIATNRIGKFVKLELLGRGGVGEVWKAYDLVIRRFVAIKFLHTLTPEHWQRFLKEAQILGKLQHPNIVPLYEIGDRFIVMPHIHGKTLDKTKLTIKQAADVIRQAAIAIAHAHSQGIIHRDLKPSNIMLEGRTVFVTDFGIAKELQVKECLSTTGDILGTPSYMSPEQVRARTKDIDARTDVYALGATLYHLLTGTVAFCNEDLYEMMRAIQEDEPVLPSRLNPEVPRDLEAIILKAMEKSPARRYKSAREMAADLDRFLKGDPVEARPSGPLDRWARQAAKHKLPGALVMVALVGIGFGVYGMSPKEQPIVPMAGNNNKPQEWIPTQDDADQQKQQSAKGKGQSYQTGYDREQSMICVNSADQAIGRKEYDKAIESAEHAIAEDPTNPEAYLVRGRVRWFKGDRDSAMKDFDKASSYGPKYEGLVDEFLKAQSQDKKSWQVPDDHRQSDFMASRASQNMMKSNYDNALAAADKSIQADPKNPAGYFQRGRAYWATNEFDKAKADFRKCAELDPKYQALVDPYLNPTKK